MRVVLALHVCLQGAQDEMMHDPLPVPGPGAATYSASPGPSVQSPSAPSPLPAVRWPPVAAGAGHRLPRPCCPRRTPRAGTPAVPDGQPHARSMRRFGHMSITFAVAHVFTEVSLDSFEWRIKRHPAPSCQKCNASSPTRAARPAVTAFQPGRRRLESRAGPLIRLWAPVAAAAEYIPGCGRLRIPVPVFLLTELGSVDRLLDAGEACWPLRAQRDGPAGPGRRRCTLREQEDAVYSPPTTPQGTVGSLRRRIQTSTAVICTSTSPFAPESASTTARTGKSTRRSLENPQLH